MKKIIFTSILMAASLAQGAISVQATLNRHEVEVGENFLLRVSVKHLNTGGAATLFQIDEEPNFTGFPGISVNQRSKSSSTQHQFVFSGGQNTTRKTRTKDFLFSLQAKAKGKYTIPSISVQVNSKKHLTHPINFTVVPSSGNSGSARRGPVPNQNPFGVIPFGLGRFLEEGNKDQDAFFRLELDKTRAYVGEEVLGKWSLYSTSLVRHIDSLKLPDLKGFWKESILNAKSLRHIPEKFKGRRYNRTPLLEYGLFPLKAGEAVVDEYEVKANTSGLTFFSSRAKTIVRKSPRRTIQVMKLPEKGRPPSFTEGVGQWEVKSFLRNKQMKLGVPVEWVFEIFGRGNPKAIALPPVALPPSVDLYDTKEFSQYQYPSPSVRTFQLLILPQKEGVLTLPSVEFAFFNPKTKSYEIQKTKALSLEILPGRKLEKKVQKPNLESPQAQPKSQLPEAFSVYQSDQALRFLRSLDFWFFIFFAQALFIFGTWWWRRRSSSPGRQLKLKLSKAFKVIHHHHARGQGKNVGAGLVASVYTVIGALEGKGSRGGDWEARLEKLPASMVQKFKKPLGVLMKDSQMLAFAHEVEAGVLKDKKIQKDLIQKMEKLLNDMVSQFDQ